MGELVLLAVAAAFYPTLLAIVILIFTRPRPARLLAAFLIGGMLTSLTIGLLIVFAAKGTGALDTSHHTVSPAVDLGVGLLSLLAAFVLVTGRERRLVERRRARREAKRAKRPDDAKDPWTTRALSRDSLPLAFALGIALDLPSLWYLIALKDIAEAHHPTSVDVLLVLMFNLIMFALIEVPLALYLIKPERSAALVARFNVWIRGHMRQIGIGIALALGLYLFIGGLINLL